MKPVVVRIGGGLGNQLFRYAAAWCLARRAGRPLRLDLTDFIVFARGRPYQMRHFAGPSGCPHWNPARSAVYLAAWVVYKRVSAAAFPRLLRLQRVRRLEEASPWQSVPAFFDPALAACGDTLYVDGNCQHLDYLTDEAGVRRELAWSRPPAARNRDWAERCATGESVSVHVRRSDYLLLDGCPVLTVDYYRAAAELVRRKVPDPVWVVFSDDVAWCRDALRFLPGARFVEGNERVPWEDLRLMAACRHHIIANSSFSWWGAYLGRDPEGVTVAPERWFKNVRVRDGLLKPGWLTAPSFDGA